MKNILLSLLLLCAWTLSAADVSGKWSGTVEVKENGESNIVPVLLILKQDGAKLTGSGGGSSDEQHPIKKGIVDGDNLTIEVDAGEATFYLDLKVDGDQITGDARRGADTPKMKMSLKRVKQDG